jgi:acyl-CoA synthetase (AMP-forming)/AMP-acid ligase II
MIFTAPDFLPTLPTPLPLQETIGDFCLTENFAKTARSDSADKRPPFVEAAIDRAWTADKIGARVAQVATALFDSWKLVPGQEWNKVVAILASNSVSSLEALASKDSLSII